MSVTSYWSAILAVFSTFLWIPQGAAEVGVTKDRILLGLSTPLTGLMTLNSAETQKGSQLVFDKVNSAGGIYGRKLELITYDDSYDPERAVLNLKKLIDVDHIFSIFQNYGSASVLAAIPLIEDRDVPFFGPIASTEAARVPVHRNIFTVRASSALEMEDMIQFVTTKLGVKAIGLVFQDDALGLGVMNAVTSALKKGGKQVAYEKKVSRNSEDEKDAELTVSGLMKAKVQAVVMGAQIHPMAAIINKAHEKGFDPIFIGNMTQASKDFIALLKVPKPWIYLAYSVPIPYEKNPLPVVQRLLEDAKAANLNALGNGFMMEGYLNALVFVEALRKAGPNLSRDGLRRALENMGNAEIAGVRIRYSSESHRGITKVYIARLLNGVYVPIEETK